jgi:hypothetical protein
MENTPSLIRPEPSGLSVNASVPASVPEAASVSPPNAVKAPAIETIIAAESTTETTFLLILVLLCFRLEKPA